MQYLQHILDFEIHNWNERLNLQYALQLESKMNEIMFPALYKEKELMEEHTSDVFLPPHFFGELAKVSTPIPLFIISYILYFIYYYVYISQLF